MKIRPNKLEVGDTVGLVALSSPVTPESLGLKVELLEQLGLRYVMGDTLTYSNRYLAGTDEERLAEFHEMIANPEIKAIFCVCGGYGLGRLVDRINYALIEENPKIIWGFSDVTALHTTLNEYAELVTFHGPMLSNSLKPLDELSTKMFQQLFFPIEMQYGEHISPLHTIHGGSVRGELTGGNLNRLLSLFGTKFEVDFRNKIVILEDIGETLEDIDRMMNQLRLSRKLEQAAGFVIGDFSRLGDGESEDDVVQLMTAYLQPLGKPVVSGFKIGHCEPNIAIPLGVDAILDADQKLLRVLPGVQ